MSADPATESAPSGGRDALVNTFRGQPRKPQMGAAVDRRHRLGVRGPPTGASATTTRSASQGAALPAKWNGALLVTVMVSVLGPGRRLVMVWNHREVHVGLVWMRSRWVVAVMWRWPWGRHWAAASVRACRRAFRRPIAAAAATAVNMRGPP